MMSRYCIATLPTPILNTPDFTNVFGSKSPSLDDQGLMRSLEMIAFPGAKFTILKQIDTHILEVTTKEYPYSPIFIDSRFVKVTEETTPEREKILPSKEKIIHFLHSSLNLPYIWGGNWGKGIPEIPFHYQTEKPKHPALSCIGLDCSGLLYEATNGYTPRNTTDLLGFGEKISSIQDVKPLDILVWRGHVIIILSKTVTIESLIGKGVILSNLESRLTKIGKTPFVIRRFLF